MYIKYHIFEATATIKIGLLSEQCFLKTIGKKYNGDIQCKVLGNDYI